VEPIDAVYLWVDGDWPGFRELRDSYATKPADRDPARFRDNLDILKYGLRSLSHVPWIRNVYLVTARPQRPRWLADHPRLKLVHHDAFIDNDLLPTFNTNAINCYLDRLPGLSQRFIYLEDDMMFAAPVTLAHFVDDQNRLRVHNRIGHTHDAALRDSPALTPGNASRAHTNHLLNEAFGYRKRPTFNHAPVFIDQLYYREMLDRWPEDFRRTATSRFRAPCCALPTYMYQHFMLGIGRGIPVSTLQTYREIYYHGLEENIPWTWLGLLLPRLIHPMTMCFNDNWGENPHPRLPAMVKRFLEKTFPIKSPFEL
jgi:hypothetical protein